MEGTILKEGNKELRIKEQILFNDASGLTFEFVVKNDDETCPYRIRIYGENLPFGNREITLDKNGIINGGGTFTGTCPFPYENK